MATDWKMREDGLDPEAPDFLYRYRSAETPYFIDEIEKSIDSRIFLNPIIKQNDPFDCFPNYLENSPAEIKKFQDKFLQKKKYVVSKELLHTKFGHLKRSERVREVRKFKKSYENRKVEQKIIKHILAKERQQTLIACFSETATNGLMWSHYASGHNGICKIFKVKNLTQNTTGDLHPINVLYSTERPSISTIDIMKFTNHGEHNFLAETRHVFDAIVRRKPADWSYENEWRIHTRGDAGGQYIATPHLALSGIIFGLNLNLERRKFITQKFGDRLKIYEAIMPEDSYELEIKKYG